MNTAALESQAYEVQIAQGKVVMQILTHMERAMEAVPKGETISTATADLLLDLSRAMTCVGGRPV